MDVLDRVCTPGGWQSSHYSVCGAKACKIGIQDPESKEWIWKSDGSGDTNIEAEKGGFSGAFKRAGVVWGIGRYLYDMKNVWVPYDSKKKKFTGDPWRFADNPWVGPLAKMALTDAVVLLRETMNNASNVDDLDFVVGSDDAKKIRKQLKLDDNNILVGTDDYEGLNALYWRLKKELTEKSEFERPE